ncbi:unnamed protein product [Nyctereutes procyonoides]|uniref:inorganic diphosphatase n=1 Tax=Nyctereutes procyonoides TaxID=34880 RepID=A0A811Y1C8_NYCPR|nr:unnamed protein product [Nyctereutes procyonoides]
MSSFSSKEHAAPFTLEYQVFLKNEKEQYISPFHDVLIYADKHIFHMVVEAPHWSNAKMEIRKLCYVANLFPYTGYIWNYGHNDKRTGCCGDNDPIDVGEIVRVKVLGILAMTDEGETGWKVIAINVDDPDAANYNEINDVKWLKPGYLEATVDWFRRYKVPGGKPESQFALNAEFKDKDSATDIIKSTHNRWRASVTKKIRPFKCDPDAAEAIMDALPPPCQSACTVPTDVEKCFHHQKN